MKNIFSILTIVLIFLLASCQDVVDVDLETAPPKLVVEASINWEKGTPGNIQRINLSTTTSYFSTTFPAVSGATVQVKNSSNIVFNFTQTGTTGEYECTNFIPKINESYTLTIIYNQQTYQATETLTAVAPITIINQNNNAGINGRQIEVKTLYNDPAVVKNFYLFKFKYPGLARPDYYVSADDFYNGNPFFSIAQEDDLKQNDIIEITHFGVSQTYFNYLSILLDIAGSVGGAPFQSPPGTVKGNVINKTSFNDFPLGYFSLSESDKRIYTVQ